MAGSMTDFLEAKTLEHTLGIATYAMPTVYMILFTADPTEAGLLTSEVADLNSYARIPLAGKLVVNNGIATNIADLIFATATGAWGNITFCGIIDSAVHGAGTLLYSSSMTNDVVIEDTDDFNFKIGKYSIELD